MATVVKQAKSWLVIETRHAEATNASCKLCTKWQEKLRKTRNFNDAMIRGIEGKALKKDNLEKHEFSAQHRDAVRLEKGPQSMSELYRTTAIGIYYKQLCHYYYILISLYPGTFFFNCLRLISYLFMYLIRSIVLSYLFIYLIIHVFSIYVGLNSSSANVSCCTNTDYK